MSRRILMVSPVATHPVDAGNRARIVALVRELRALGHTVDFALTPVNHCTFDAEAMRAFFGPERVHLLPWSVPRAVRDPVARLRRGVGRALKVDRAFEWALDDWVDPAILPALRELQQAHRFDTVFVEYVFASKAFEAFPSGCLRVLDTHDRFASRHRTYLAAGQKPQWFSTSLSEEARGLRRADVVVAIQDREAEAFRAQLGADTTPQVTTVGHLLDLDATVTSPDTASAVIFGSGNPLNVEGARYFVERVMPSVRARRGDFTLYLAGDVGRGVADAPGIVKLGRVAHVNDAFGAAAVTVNPVRAGTGINIKLLEALAASVPNLSTESGLRGLEAHRDDAIRAVPDDDPAAFADALLALLDDRAAAQALAQRGHALARRWNAAQMTALVAALA